ncbi:hypothetical protein CDEF62S_01000 [Castellaniella defragrans]
MRAQVQPFFDVASGTFKRFYNFGPSSRPTDANGVAYLKIPVNVLQPPSSQP